MPTADASRPISVASARRREADVGAHPFAEVLAAAQAGERGALETLYRAFASPIHAYLSARLPGEADDLTADVFVAMVTGVASFEGDERGCRSWLFSIAHRRIADRRRRWARDQTQARAALLAPQSGHDVEAEAMASLAQSAALRSIAELPPAQAEVVLLRVVADLSVEDVATIMGKRPGAVRALQLRALRRLARQLSKPTGGGPERPTR